MNYPTQAEVTALLTAVPNFTIPGTVDLPTEILVAIAKAETHSGWRPLMAGSAPTTRVFDPIYAAGYGTPPGYGFVDLPNTLGSPVWTGGLFPFGRGGYGYPLDLRSKCRTVSAVRVGGAALPATNAWQLDRTGTILRFLSPPFGGPYPATGPGFPGMVEIDADFGHFANGQLPADMWDAVRKIAAAGVLGIRREGLFGMAQTSWEEAGVKESIDPKLVFGIGQAWLDEAAALLESPLNRRVAFF